jgi:hypothetical protein
MNNLKRIDQPVMVVLDPMVDLFLRRFIGNGTLSKRISACLQEKLKQCMERGFLWELLPTAKQTFYQRHCL